MKTLNFVSRFFFPDRPGGAEKVFYEIYKRASKDFNVRTIASYMDKSKFRRPFSIFKAIRTKNALWRYIFYTFNLTLRNLFGKSKLTHANNIECIRLDKRPFILTIHHVGHLIYNEARKQTPFTWFQRKMLVWQANRADIVTTVSDSTKKDLMKIGVKTKIIVVPNGVDTSLFKPAKKRRNKKFIISHIGRISPEKNQDFTIKAIETLPQSIKKGIELHIIGSVSDEDYFKSLKREKWIKYFTDLEDKEFSVRTSQSDLAVFPTKMTEGFGLVVLEAMACGVPVLASDQKAIREAGGKVCQYFKQNDMKDFQRKLTKLYKSKRLREKLSKEGIKRAKLFSWDNVYKKYKKIYDKMIA